MAEVTRDALFAGAVAITQPARRGGYRVNVDALLLAAFAAGRIGARRSSARAARHAVDLGAGVGAVGLSLLHFGGAQRITMVEVDPVLADLARTNARDNGWADRIEVVTGDVAVAAVAIAKPGASADLVVCNPPYVTPGRGRVPAERVRRAKYGELDAFTDAARRIAGRRARVCFVYPAPDAMRLTEALRARGLEPKRICAVHGRAADPARLVLVEAVAGKPGGLQLEPPFVETDTGGGRSAMARALVTDNGTSG
jgi:tRNA1Val (adenine37-N6)-methyltransferase